MHRLRKESSEIPNFPSNNQVMRYFRRYERGCFFQLISASMFVPFALQRWNYHMGVMCFRGQPPQTKRRGPALPYFGTPIYTVYASTFLPKNSQVWCGNTCGEKSVSSWSATYVPIRRQCAVSSLLGDRSFMRFFLFAVTFTSTCVRKRSYGNRSTTSTQCRIKQVRCL